VWVRSIGGIERILDSRVGKAIARFDLIGPGDRVMVALSGGKDSFSLLFTLRRLSAKAPISYRVVAVHVDAGYPGHDTTRMEEYLAAHGFEYEIIRTGIFDLIPQKVSPKDNPCYFCARMRRGALYGRAGRGDFTKIALGHHQEDLMESLLMNLFFVGQIRALGPKFVTDDGRHTVIRPLALTEERVTARYAEAMKFPVVEACPYSERGAANRRRMRALIEQVQRIYPRTKKSIMHAMANVDPIHLLDPRLTRRDP
jgi:tRNA 2-thiocytidine biosynthesis protein TtcA